MKHQGKFLPLILVLSMIVSFILPASTFAAPPLGTDGKILINPPSGHSLVSDDFKAYELFDLTGISGAEPNVEYAYEPTSAVIAFLAVPGMSAKYGEGLAGSEAAEAFRQWLQHSSRTEAEIVVLAKELTTNVSTLTAVGQSNVSKTVNGQIQIENLNYGYYLVTGGSTPSSADGTAYGDTVISRGMLLNVFDNSGNKTTEITLKADAPTVGKEVWYPDATNAGGSIGSDEPVDENDPGWQDWSTINIGQTLFFKLNLTVPNMTGYETYKFVATDTLSKGLTYNPDSLQVQLVKEGSSSVTLTNPGDYTLAVSAATEEITPSEYVDGTKLIITLTDLKTLVNDLGWSVVITYNATLNGDAVVGNPGNPNKVKLEYSNNPNWDGQGEEPTGDTPEEESRVYTFDLEVFKYTGQINNEPTPLQGAEFNLRLKSTLALIQVVPYTEDGYNYRVATAEDIEADEAKQADEKVVTTNLVSGADGKIKIKGLKVGTYELKETKAPAGFNLLPDWITDIIIEKDNSAQGYKLTVGVNPENAVNVLNNTGGQLPGTGGIGIYFFLALGGIMAALLTGAFIVYRRKSALNDLNVG